MVFFTKNLNHKFERLNLSIILVYDICWFWYLLLKLIYTDMVSVFTLIKMVQTASLLGTHELGWEFDSAAQISKRPGSVWNCLWGHALKNDLMGSIAWVGYCIPVPDFYLVPHGLLCRKSNLMDQSIIIIDGVFSV